MNPEPPDDGPDRAWWKEAVVYQIYPRSFNDADGDGVGDIPGIVERLDHLDDLGVDAVWLCPVYESPNHDNGYDVSDHRAIGSEYGTMADWERLLEGLHDRGIRLVMDLVVNHTSSEHEWFRRSRSDPDGEYGEYYIWRDGDPEAPNNWESAFGGSAWSYDDERGAWYLHLFDTTQPDLNWRNPRVRGEVTDLMRWWLDKGVDGFRLDAINLLSKPAGYPDGDPDADLVGAGQFFHGPRLEAYLRELAGVLAAYDAVSVGEMARTDVDTAARYLGDDEAGLGMIFQSEHLEVDTGSEGGWDPDGWGTIDLPAFKRAVSRWQTGLRGRGWNAVFLGNHDHPRIVSRFGDPGRYRRESATLLATFLLTLSGTPFLYQGDEIGMTNTEFETLEEVDDVATVGAVEDLLERGAVDSVDEAMGLVNHRSRDHARTPVQWSDGPHAGFTDGEPWLPVNDNYPEINVDAERTREGSISRYYRRLIELRRDNDVLVYGTYDLLAPDHPRLYAYTRTLGDERLLVVLNWSDAASEFDPGTIDDDVAEVVVANHEDAPVDLAGAGFRPYEAAVYRLAG